MTEHFNKHLRNKRIVAELNESQTAKMFGMSLNEYYDLEEHDDEWMQVVPFLTLKNIISYFDLKLSKFVELPSGRPVDSKLDLNDFIKKSRLELGLSREEFADKVGFFEPFCEVIEGHANGLFLWPLEDVVGICRTYGWDAGSVIKKIVP